MAEKITVPTLGESVTEATVSKWLKSQGESVTADEPIVELETDKVNVEVPAPANGVLDSIAVKEGETVNVGSLLGIVNGSSIQNENNDKEVKKSQLSLYSRKSGSVRASYEAEGGESVQDEEKPEQDQAQDVDQDEEESEKKSVVLSDEEEDEELEEKLQVIDVSNAHLERMKTKKLAQAKNKDPAKQKL